jgi:hypothetical protein
MAIAFIMLGTYISHVFGRGESFEPYRSQVHVGSSELQFGDLRAGPTVAVVGTIQNESSVLWKSVTLEVRFFDKSHKLIDTKQSRRWSDDLSLPAKGTCAFKISQPREFNIEVYNTCEVHVAEASDRHSFLQ